MHEVYARADMPFDRMGAVIAEEVRSGTPSTHPRRRQALQVTSFHAKEETRDSWTHGVRSPAAAPNTRVVLGLIAMLVLGATAAGASAMSHSVAPIPRS